MNFHLRGSVHDHENKQIGLASVDQKAFERNIVNARQKHQLGVPGKVSESVELFKVHGKRHMNKKRPGTRNNAPGQRPLALGRIKLCGNPLAASQAS